MSLHLSLFAAWFHNEGIKHKINCWKNRSEGNQWKKKQNRPE